MRFRYYISSTLAIGLWLDISEAIKDVVVAMHNSEILWTAGCFVVAFLTALVLPRVIHRQGETVLSAIGTGALLWGLGLVALWSVRLSVNTLSLSSLLLASAWSLTEMIVASLIALAIYRYVRMTHLRVIEPHGI